MFDRFGNIINNTTDNPTGNRTNNNTGNHFRNERGNRNRSNDSYREWESLSSGQLFLLIIEIILSLAILPGLINIGFMVFQPEIFEKIDGDDIVFEREPLGELVRNKELISRTHTGYWQCMDTLREKQQIEKLWNSGNAPWKIWED